MNCWHCGTEFSPRKHYPHQRYCTRTCAGRAQAVRRPIPSLSRELNLPRGTVGALNELRVSIDLIERGFHVFRALSPCCPCDLVVFSPEGACLRVEVKTSYARAGRLMEPSAKALDGRIFDILALVTTGSIVYRARESARLPPQLAPAS